MFDLFGFEVGFGVLGVFIDLFCDFFVVVDEFVVGVFFVED